MTAVRAFMLAAAVALGAPAAHAELRVFIVSGLGGDADYERKFLAQAKGIAAAAVRATGTADEVTVLSGDQARKDALQREFKTFAARVKPEDQVAVILIGHGTFDGEEYRFNLPGPDITGRELAALLDRLPANQQLVVNATSTSGAVIDRWKRPNRIVITATKSGGERNATRFAEFWLQALSSTEADRDKNDVVTAAEAFEFAARKVADTFKADAALATEHARMEGGNAARFVVARLGDAAVVASDTALAALLTKQADIEQQFDELKGRKATLDREHYYDELEKVLVALARLDRNIDQRRAALRAPTTRQSDGAHTP